MPQFHKLAKRKKSVKITNSSTRTRPHPAPLLLLTTVLSVFGLLMIFNVSAISALSDFGDKYYYVKEQSQWLGLGIVALIFFSFFHYKRLYAIALPVLVTSIALLIAVFIPGIGVHTMGASRWLNLGFTTLQPTEFVKLAMIIYLSAWLSHTEKKRFGSFLLLLGLIILPIIVQPDLGSAVVVVTISLGVYFLSGAPLSHFFLLLPGMLGAIGLLAVSAPYRLQRVQTFFNPDLDPEGSSYHLRQILIALGSGGWFGVGLGKSRQKFAYLPEVTTDSIFAVIAEEIGFVGATLLLVIMLLILFQGIRIALSASDRFGRLLAGGIVLALSLQMIVNLGAMVSLLPLTGIPLPFISYGGSNLIVTFAMIGILTNIARKS